MLTAEQQRLAPTRGLGPVQRRYAVEGIEVRAAEDNPNIVNFFGHASVTGKSYEMYGGPEEGGWDETVARGAFKKTLSESPDVAFLLNHGGMTLARTKSGTLNLAEDKIGLAVNAALDRRISVVNDLTVAMDRRDLDEMSFAFRVTQDEWLDAEGNAVPWWDLSGIQRNIKEVSLAYGDVSVVNYGANPFTDAGLRAAELVGALRELRAGATLSGATLATLHQVLDLISSADDGVDEAQVVLADLMGVPNPDKPDEETEMVGGVTDAPMTLEPTQMSVYDAEIVLRDLRRTA